MKRNSIGRNIAIFSLIATAARWIGLGANSVLRLNDPTQNLGMLIFLILPFLTGLLLRIFGGDGWSDIGWKSKQTGRGAGYWVALLIYPVLVGVLLIAGRIAGAISFEDLSAVEVMGFQGAGALLVSFWYLFAVDFIKNFFEEFAWRGYLTPRLKAAGWSDLPNHLLTGIVWAGWHVPYWLFFLDKSMLEKFTSLDMAVFIPLSILNLITSAILYGEVRLLSGSTVAAVVLHSSANAITLSLLLEGFVNVSPPMEIWFNPGGIGLVGILLVTLSGLGLYAFRVRRMRHDTA